MKYPSLLLLNLLNLMRNSIFMLILFSSLSFIVQLMDELVDLREIRMELSIDGFYCKCDDFSLKSCDSSKEMMY